MLEVRLTITYSVSIDAENDAEAEKIAEQSQLIFHKSPHLVTEDDREIEIFESVEVES